MKGSSKKMFNASLYFRWSVILILTLSCAGLLFAQTAAQFQHTGVVYFQRGQLKEALAAFSKVIQMDSKNALAYTNRGLVRYRMGDMKGALVDHNKAIEHRVKH